MPTTAPTATLLDFLANLSPTENCQDTLLEHLQNHEPTPLHLHAAAARGNTQACNTLIQFGKIPWNALVNGLSIGQVALENGWTDCYNELVQIGVRAEFVLSMMGQRVVQDGDLVNDDACVSNGAYLTRKLFFSQGKLLDSDGNAVMMGWETPLMALHTQVIAPTSGRDVLNVGFGLGIIDTMLQETNPNSHTIIEAHPDVYAQMIKDGWNDKPNVRILFGRWQDVLDQLTSYDGIFFDTFGEYYDDLKEFHEELPNLLRQDGIYSFFNGLAGTNPYFHDVACQMAELDLAEMGLKTTFESVQVDELGDDVWQDTKRAYWNLPTYKVPTVTFDPSLC